MLEIKKLGKIIPEVGGHSTSSGVTRNLEGGKANDLSLTRRVGLTLQKCK